VTFFVLSVPIYPGISTEPYLKVKFTEYLIS